MSSDQRKDCTVYIKGFLTHKSLTFSSFLQLFFKPTPRRFETKLETATDALPQCIRDGVPMKDWLHSHSRLSSTPSHSWSNDSYVWTWPSGRLPQLPAISYNNQHIATVYVPYATLLCMAGAFASSALRWRRTSSAQRQNFFQSVVRKSVLNPRLFGIGMLIDGVLVLSTLLYEFKQAKRNAVLYANELAGSISELRKKYNYIRVVAYSLGCMHAVEAMDLLPSAEKPDELHLVASCDSEKRIEDKLKRSPAKSFTCHYYCESDSSLKYIAAVPTLGKREAVGLYPLSQEKYNNTVISKRIDHEQFKKSVHHSMAENFYKFAHSMNMQQLP